MNLSYLDNYWNGTRAKHFSDFVKQNEVLKRQKMLADIAQAGFKTIRLPICFGAWASLKPPYDWETTEGITAADLFVKWALEAKLNVIIDLHHTEFDGSFPDAASTERLTALWKRIAERYKNSDPEKVFFEIRNEPHDMAADKWRAQAEELIKVVRQIAPDHTLIVGFHDWNSRKALIDSEPFSDSNIIYTFHYYDPFIFTHQGATWAGEGLPELKDVSFPWSKEYEIKTPETAKGKWVENLIKNYRTDSKPEKMFGDLKAAKNWSVEKKVPILLGEFGSYNLRAAPESRCRHAETVYSALGKLEIPAVWWEWDGGFTMFEKGTDKIMDCMQKAVDSYNQSVK
ncbi:MAG: glycoside hydrolase family 5 protein [Pyrinomonadaceae bacterium]